jgi:hypothetical protein
MSRFPPKTRSWAAQAFEDLGMSIALVDLPSDVRQRVRDAQ